mgnify:CR=1 FL=1
MYQNKDEMQKTNDKNTQKKDDDSSISQISKQIIVNPGNYQFSNDSLSNNEVKVETVDF